MGLLRNLLISIKRHIVSKIGDNYVENNTEAYPNNEINNIKKVENTIDTAT